MTNSITRYRIFSQKTTPEHKTAFGITSLFLVRSLLFGSSVWSIVRHCALLSAVRRPCFNFTASFCIFAPFVSIGNTLLFSSNHFYLTMPVDHPYCKVIARKGVTLYKTQKNKNHANKHFSSSARGSTVLAAGSYSVSSLLLPPFSVLQEKRRKMHHCLNCRLCRDSALFSPMEKG